MCGFGKKWKAAIPVHSFKVRGSAQTNWKEEDLMPQWRGDGIQNI